jgi:hypothetical protein
MVEVDVSQVEAREIYGLDLDQLGNHAKHDSIFSA